MHFKVFEPDYMIQKQLANHLKSKKSKQSANVTNFDYEALDKKTSSNLIHNHVLFPLSKVTKGPVFPLILQACLFYLYFYCRAVTSKPNGPMRLHIGSISILQREKKLKIIVSV